MPRKYHEFIEWMFHREEISRRDYEEYFGVTPKEPKVTVRLKGFAKRFESFFDWLAKPEPRTMPYQRRIERYFQQHPEATLREARGHG